MTYYCFFCDTDIPENCTCNPGPRRKENTMDTITIELNELDLDHYATALYNEYKKYYDMAEQQTIKNNLYPDAHAHDYYIMMSNKFHKHYHDIKMKQIELQKANS
jgi:hypothetical protein